MKSLDEAQSKFKEGRKGAEQFSAACYSIKVGAEQAGKGAERGSKSLGQFASSLVRIAKYRLIRTALKELVSAFKEGLQNAYQFSKGIGGDLAAAMDAMSVKSQTMRNQLGAAFGEVLTNIMPVLLRMIELVRSAANAISQFFAMLGGRGSYLKAVDVTADMNKNLGGAGAAAKELRRTLMGFDEINRLDAPDSPSGGGGSGNMDASNKMFEELPLDEWTQKLVPFKERLDELWAAMRDGFTSAWNYIKEHFDFEAFFYNAVDVIQGLVQFVAGILSGDWSTAFAGAALAVQGFGAIINQIIDFAFALIDSFFGWAINGINGFFDWLTEKTGISFEALRTFCLGIVNTIKLLLMGLFDSVKEIFNGIITFVSGVFSGDLSKAGDGIVQIVKGILNAGVALIELGINTVINAINGVLALAEGIVGALGGAFNLQITPVQLPRFATGGFVEDGLFMANHGELVGQFSNGNTAVANNEQIIQGIERGVYNAMTSALAGQNSRNRDIRVYLDGKEIGAATRRYERNVNRATGVALG